MELTVRNARTGAVCAVIVVACFASLAPRARGGELLDNEKLNRALEQGIAPEVIAQKMKTSQCHFDASLDALVDIKKAAEKGTWKAEDIKVLQQAVIAAADGDKRRRIELVARAMNVFENADPDEYGRMMRILRTEGKPIVPHILDQIEQESERKRGGMLDALGQIGDKSDNVVKQAILMLNDRSKPVRMEAAKCVAKLAGANTCDDLVTRLANRDDKLDGVCMALGYLGDPKAADALVRTLKYAYDSDTRVCAAFALGQLRANSKDARASLLEAVLDEHDEKLRDSAANSLALIGEKQTPNYIIKAFQRYHQGREEIIKHLASFKSATSVEFLLEQLENDAPKIKRAADETLQVLTGEKQPSVDEWKSWWEVTRTRPDWIQVSSDSPKIPEPGAAPKPTESDPITTTR